MNLIQVLREKIAWLEATNQDLCRELHVYRSRGIAIDHSEMDTKVYTNSSSFLFNIYKI